MPPSTQIVGILNLTPDSFSDGGIYDARGTALTHARDMLAHGVHVIDIGAESTRPGATALTAEEEWTRLEPVLAALITLAHDVKTTISIDTRHAATAAHVLELGADWINDVNGLRDKAMLEALAKHNCSIVFMHSLTIPADPTMVVDKEKDIIAVLIEFAHAAIQRCADVGIQKQRLIFDPGLGFGKTAEQSLEILRRVDELKTIGLPLFIGHSRKSFLAKFSPAPAQERDALTLAVSEFLLMKKMGYLRVHNVARHMELLKLHEALHASAS